MFKLLTLLMALLIHPSLFAEKKCNDLFKEHCTDKGLSKSDCLMKHNSKFPQKCLSELAQEVGSSAQNDPCTQEITEACEGKGSTCLSDLGTQVSDRCLRIAKEGSPEAFLKLPVTKTLMDGCAKSFEDQCFVKHYGKYDNAAEANREVSKCLKDVMAKKTYEKSCDQAIKAVVDQFKKNKDSLYKAIED
jgi:hypothetical protein